MRTLIFILFLFWLGNDKVFSQYISLSQPDPSYNCPVVCQGGTLQLKVFQIENFPAGTQIQALLSNATGSFASGTQILPVTQYSITNGSSWTNGPYLFSSNITNLLIRVTIPITTPVGTAYSVKMRASTGYTSNGLFQCNGGNVINVIPANVPLPAVAQSQSGNGQWIGHIYNWTATTGGILNTPALIAEQNFFGSSNYQGHVVYNALNLDLFFSQSGGVPGSTANGSSFNCGLNYTTNFSLRLRRTENFAPGFYQLSIQGDDGIRLSIDGGTTWILDSFIEQAYTGSFRSTATVFPTGICLSGNTDLVIEYFQRPADARLTFTATPLSVPILNNPQSVSLCLAESANFSVNSIPGYSYQWFESSDNGATFSPLVNSAPYTGVTSPNLSINPVTSTFNGNQYYCLASGSCGTPLESSPAVLTLNAGPNVIQHPANAVYCAGQNLQFFGGVIPNGVQVQWQLSTDGGSSFSPISNGASYAGVTSGTLTVLNPNDQVQGQFYRICYTACGETICSNPAEVLPGSAVNISQQPQNLTLCAGTSGSVSTEATNAAAYVWQLESGGSFIDLNLNPQQGFTAANSSTLLIDGGILPVGTYSVRCRITGSCAGDVFSIPVQVQIDPAASITVQPQNIAVCEGSDAVFTINALGTTFQWQQSNDNGQTFTNLGNSAFITGATTNQLTLLDASVSLNGIFYQCLVVNDCGEVSSQAVQLTVEAAPALTQQPVDESGCSGESIQITAAASTAVNWQWFVSFDNGDTYQPLENQSPYSGTSDAVLTIDPLTDAMNGLMYRAEISSCSTSIRSNAVELTVNSNPEITISSPSTSIALGDTLELTVTGEAEFTWTQDASLSCTNCATPLAFPTETTTYTVTGVNSFGCVARDSIQINVDIICGEIFIPNIFSPNGKGPIVNESYCVYSDCVDLFKLVIYNRWGEKLFETAEITNCWDGKFNGTEAPTGVYAYNLYLKQLDGAIVNKTGTITLIK
ncbi:MAG: gliding motility-associated C-terminal domain-containing protein [Bacteroidia bacterium]